MISLRLPTSSPSTLSMKIGAVEIGFREAVGFPARAPDCPSFPKAERVEIGDQMAAHPVGPDHHERAHRIARRAAQILLGSARRRAAFAFLSIFWPSSRLIGRPVAVERADQFAIGGSAASPSAATRTARRLAQDHVLLGSSFRSSKKALPVVVDGSRIGS